VLGHPSETGGPYPGDGTNGPNVLVQTGIVRSDIRSSFGTSGTTTAPGVPLTVTLQLVNTNANCAPLVGYVVYLWHCDASGRYSMYSAGVTTNGAACYTIPVYRLYNNGYAKGIDSNHRYTASVTVAAQMQTLGWQLEDVAFCALAASAGS
jgi:hypothetical protein